MALINFAGFEDGLTGATPIEAASSGGTFEVTSAQARHGTYSFRAHPATTAVGFARFRAFATSGDSSNYSVATSYYGFYFRAAALPSANSEEIFSVRHGAGIKMTLRINSSGNLLAFGTDGTTQIGSTGATVLALNTWYCIGVSCATGASAALEVRLNGATEITGTGDLNASNGASCDLGKATNRNGQSVDFYYDTLQIDDAEFPPERTVLMMRPIGDGNAVTWTRGGTDTGNDWDQVDEVPASTSEYLVSTLTSGNRSQVTLQSPATVGISGTIAAVKPMGYLVRDGAANGTFAMNLRSGGTDSDNAANKGSFLNYEACARSGTSVLVQNPVSAAAWTIADLTTLEIGVVEKETTDRTRCAWLGCYVLFVPAGAAEVLPALQQAVVPGAAPRSAVPYH